MPFYLEEDLPSLKFYAIRQEFKEMDKIQCPRLTFFNRKIAVKFQEKKKTQSQQKLSRCEEESREAVRVINNIREELKYTLVTADRKSNVVTKLITRAS
jgi:hypothetical protein